MNLAWLTGRMSEGEMKEEHPLQLEEMKTAELIHGEATEPVQSPRPPAPPPPPPARPPS
jgi:hypothetical protein